MIQRIVTFLVIFILSACASEASPIESPEEVIAVPTDTMMPTPTEEIPTAEMTLTKEPEPTIAEVKTFFDDMEREITLNAPPQRIVTLGPSILESLFAIGAGSQVVGREEFSTYPEEALEITSVGSLWGELPTEAILALEPDLVIAPEIISPEQIQSLEDLGLAVYFQANPVDFTGLWDNLRDLGELSGHVDEAEDLISTLNDRVNAVVKIIEPIEDRPTVFYELDATDPQNPFTIGSGTFIDTIITMAGGINIGSALEGQYAPISSEEVIIQDPEVILLADAPYGITPDNVAERAGWEGISAVVDDQVFAFDPFLVSVPGPRLVDGLEAMAIILHPQAFE